MDDNYQQLVKVHGFSIPEQATLAANSIRSSFASDERKSALLDEVSEWVKESLPPQ